MNEALTPYPSPLMGRGGLNQRFPNGHDFVSPPPKGKTAPLFVFDPAMPAMGGGRILNRRRQRKGPIAGMARSSTGEHDVFYAQYCLDKSHPRYWITRQVQWIASFSEVEFSHFSFHASGISFASTGHGAS